MRVDDHYTDLVRCVGPAAGADYPVVCERFDRGRLGADGELQADAKVSMAAGHFQVILTRKQLTNDLVRRALVPL